MYSREIDDQILTFAASGWTYEFLFVLYDYETETIWYPSNIGEAGCGCSCVLWGIAGQFAGRMILSESFFNMPWNIWLAGYPDTKIMDGGFGGTIGDTTSADYYRRGQTHTARK